MNQPLISGRTKTALYRYLKHGGGSYNDLRMCFRNCGIEPDQRVDSASTTNKDQFLDSYIIPLDLARTDDAERLVNFIAQAVEFIAPDEHVVQDAKRLYESLMHDGWEFRDNAFVRHGAQLLDGQTYVTKPSSIEEVLRVVIRGIARARSPLQRRRVDCRSLSFDNEYDYQDLLHSLLAPWVSDIRREDYVSKYLGTNKRVDFYLPDYSIIIELKFIRDPSHAKKVGDELAIDVTHYQKHQDCKTLWIVIADPASLLENPDGLVRDLGGASSRICVKAIVV